MQCITKEWGAEACDPRTIVQFEILSDDWQKLQRNLLWKLVSKAIRKSQRKITVLYSDAGSDYWTYLSNEASDCIVDSWTNKTQPPQLMNAQVVRLADDPYGRFKVYLNGNYVPAVYDYEIKEGGIGTRLILTLVPSKITLEEMTLR